MALEVEAGGAAVVEDGHQRGVADAEQRARNVAVSELMWNARTRALSDWGSETRGASWREPDPTQMPLARSMAVACAGELVSRRLIRHGSTVTRAVAFDVDACAVGGCRQPLWPEDEPDRRQA